MEGGALSMNLLLVLSFTWWNLLTNTEHSSAPDNTSSIDSILQIHQTRIKIGNPCWSLTDLKPLQCRKMHIKNNRTCSRLALAWSRISDLSLTRKQGFWSSGVVSWCLNISRFHHMQCLFQNHNQNLFLFHIRHQLQIPIVNQGIQLQSLHLFREM